MSAPDPAYPGQMADSLLDRVARLPFVIPGDPNGVPASVLLALAPVEGADDLELGVTPFLAGDALKILLAAGLLPGAWALVGRNTE